MLFDGNYALELVFFKNVMWLKQTVILGQVSENYRGSQRVINAYTYLIPAFEIIAGPM